MSIRMTHSRFILFGFATAGLIATSLSDAALAQNQPRSFSSIGESYTNSGAAPAKRASQPSKEHASDGSEPLVVKYGSSSPTSGSQPSQSGASATANSNTPETAPEHKIDWSKFKSGASKLFNKAEQVENRAASTPGANQIPGVSQPNSPLSTMSRVPGFPGLNGYNSVPGVNTPLNAIREADGIFKSRPIAGTMENPAGPIEGSGNAAISAEHQRVIDNMRKHGYSEARIQAAEANGTIGASSGNTGNYSGEKVEIAPGVYAYRNGVNSPQQALNNITGSGLFDTPISTRREDQITPYNQYKTNGGTASFQQWLKGAR